MSKRNKGLLFGVGFIVLAGVVVTLVWTNIFKLVPENPEDLGAAFEKRHFAVKEHYFDNDRLYFKYYAPYGGMTEVDLVAQDGSKLWHGQYTDNEGIHEISFKTSKLNPGEEYTFKFKFKEDSLSVPISVPLM